MVHATVEPKLSRVGAVVGGAFEAIGDPAKTGIEVILIRPGLSANGLRYSAEVVRRSASLWEGANCFPDHPTAVDLTRAGGRSVRDLAGHYRDVRYVEGVGLKATLRPLLGTPAGDAALELARQALVAREAGEGGPQVGISADLVVRKRPTGRNEDGRVVWEVEQILKVNSADVVVNPSAGGEFERVLEAEDLRGLIMDSEINNDGAKAATLAQELASAQASRVALSGELLNARLANSSLTKPASAHVRRQFEGRAFEPVELDQTINEMRGLLASAYEPRVIAGAGALRPSDVQVGASARDRVFLAVERLFGLPLPDYASDIPRLSGIREAYILLTGDKQFTGRYNWEESVVREANEVTTSVLNDALTNAMNKRLVMDYKSQPLWWRPFVTVTAINDLKTQTRVKLDDFTALATVPRTALTRTWPGVTTRRPIRLRRGATWSR